MNLGFRGSFARTSNIYYGDKSNPNNLNETSLYFYSSSSGYLGKLYYSLGVGVSGRISSAEGETFSKWTARPEFNFFYTLRGWRLQAYGNVYQNSPSLTEMASAEYRMNDYEIKRGNPDLTDWWSYRLGFRISKSFFGFLNLQNTLSYTNAIHPVSQYIIVEENDGTTDFITTYANQKYSKKISDSFALSGSITSNLSFGIGVDYDNYRARGVNYTHSLSDWTYSAKIDWFAGAWNIGGRWQSNSKSLVDQEFRYYGPTNELYINYMIGGNFRLGLNGQYLLCKHGKKYVEKYHTAYMEKSETTIDLSHRSIIRFNITYVFSKGKQRKQAKIDMKNSDDVDGVFK